MRTIKLKFTENHIFLCFIIIIFAFGMFSLIKPERKTSTAENRSLSTFEHLSIDKLVKGTFQKNFENAISDQFPFGEKIRRATGETISILPTFGIHQAICSNRYVEAIGSRDHERVTFNCEDYIIYNPNSHDLKKEEKSILKNIARYNHVNTLADTYYYYLNDSYAYDFENNQLRSDYASLLKNSLTGNHHFSELNITNYEEYKKYFYKTDHHWNYVGSYQGFLDIAKMLSIESPVQPTATFTHHEDFFGSHARVTQNYNYHEDFTIYQFNLPKHDTLLNRYPGEYGNYEAYINHKYTYDKQTNYYMYFYGNDYGELTFDFHQPQKENLLIISNSYSNAVDKLIAQYFNKTYVVDLRFYQTHLGEKFTLSKYIKDRNIKKVLFIMNSGFLTSENLNNGLEL